MFGEIKLFFTRREGLQGSQKLMVLIFRNSTSVQLQPKTAKMQKLELHRCIVSEYKSLTYRIPRVDSFSCIITNVALSIKSDKCRNCMGTLFCMLVNSLMQQNNYCYEVINAIIAIYNLICWAII